ncbi:MAG: precorrin-6y C5,15-methyltransferase (decarboxylating) subunit CbiE [Gemmataceae bacterium]|nr:precorrin-6y C5,15-methyltransferase (decarboxylating) subunit CbiE [Gemmataceae bacterium]
MEHKVHIIGIGTDGIGGLAGKPRELLQAAELILGAEAALALIPELTAERLVLSGNLHDAVRKLEASGHRRTVVLAGGDPLFYGVARYLCEKLGSERFEVWPHVSTMQLAFARIKESWEEAYLTNLATHSLDSVLDRVRTAETVGIFTSDEETPPIVARQLLARGIDYFHAFVCENLGAPNERVTQGELEEIQEMDFDALNVMILKRKPDRPDLQKTLSRFRRFGNLDDAFIQSRPKSGLITGAEVRAIALAKLDVQHSSVIWDIGAGAGAVAIEAAQLATSGMVYAIEQDVADYHLIVANAQTFGIKNLTAVHGMAPAVFDGLPAPDAVFVGGIRREVARLLESVFRVLRPGGRLVVNVASLEALSATYAAMKLLAPTIDGTLVNIARGNEQLETMRFEALNPTFLLTIVKPI